MMFWFGFAVGVVVTGVIVLWLGGLVNEEN